MSADVQKVVKDLSDRFSGVDGVSFEVMGDIFPVVSVKNEAAQASVALYGAHVLSYVPQGQEPVLWLTKGGEVVEGQSIRGGIPVCWPWFGAHPQDAQKPLHGFVRNVSWQLERIDQIDVGNTELVFSLTEAAMSPADDAQPFRVELKVCVGSELRVELGSKNTGSEKLYYTAGLHSYFNVGDISKVAVEGVDGHGCFNKESGNEETQSGDLTFDGLTTRIYRNINSAVINDPVLQRRITVGVQGGESIVVWNPGAGVEERFAGFAAGDERTMLCVEAANPVGYGIELEPGQEHCLSTSIRCDGI